MTTAHPLPPSLSGRDIDRLDRLAAAGWRVIRVTARHLRRPGTLRSRVVAALRERS